MTDYVPTPCAQYARYELAILRHRRLRLLWCSGNVFHHRLVRPIDRQTREGEEFLICTGLDGDRLSIRLDQIRKAETA
ncbi:MAG: transcriptional antiterminator, Rof [Acidiferrobacterales bacterium]